MDLAGNAVGDQGLAEGLGLAEQNMAADLGDTMSAAHTCGCGRAYPCVSTVFSRSGPRGLLR